MDEHRGNAARNEKGQFVVGHTGLPGGGRPRGARNKLGEAFVADLFADWQRHGADTIVRVREEQPGVYLKVIAGLLPQNVKVELRAGERLQRILDALEAAAPATIEASAREIEAELVECDQPVTTGADGQE